MNNQKTLQTNQLFKDYRLEAGLSFSALGKLAKVSASTVKSAEDGKKIQDVKAYRIARALSQALKLAPPLSYESLHIETM